MPTKAPHIRVITTAAEAIDAGIAVSSTWGAVPAVRRRLADTVISTVDSKSYVLGRLLLCLRVKVLTQMHDVAAISPQVMCHPNGSESRPNGEAQRGLVVGEH